MWTDRFLRSPNFQPPCAVCGHCRTSWHFPLLYSNAFSKLDLAMIVAETRRAVARNIQNEASSPLITVLPHVKPGNALIWIASSPKEEGRPRRLFILSQRHLHDGLCSSTATHDEYQTAAVKRSARIRFYRGPTTLYQLPGYHEVSECPDVLPHLEPPAT